MHKNLFNYGDDDEVYASLQRDYRRDSRQVQVMDLLAVGLVVYIARDLGTWDAVATILLAAIVMSRLNTFIDNSNRNFFMHLIDWQRARK